MDAGGRNGGDGGRRDASKDAAAETESSGSRRSARGEEDDRFVALEHALERAMEERDGCGRGWRRWNR